MPEVGKAPETVVRERFHVGCVALIKKKVAAALLEQEDLLMKEVQLKV